MKPSDFLAHPYDSVFSKNESEVVARNIMVILMKTGNEFGEISYSTYKEFRLMDGNFSEAEYKYFEEVKAFCFSESNAKKFSLAWR
jgi:hypothetical protein